MGKLDGKVAIITGGGRGVGRGIAMAMAKEGATLVLAEIVDENAAAVTREVEALGSPVLPVHCDVTNKDDIKRTVATTAARFGKVDILVNCAQQWTHKPFIEMTDEDMNLALDTGLWGTFWFMQECFPHLKEHGGKIINFGSSAGIMGMETWLCYAAAKEAIRATTRVAAREWGKYNINVNCICPTADAPLMLQYMKEYFGVSDNMSRIKLGKGTGGFGSCEYDIGPVVVFLASADSDYITGHTFMVDGGVSMDAGR